MLTSFTYSRNIELEGSIAGGELSKLVVEEGATKIQCVSIVDSFT